MHVALSYNRLNRLREDKYHSAKAAGYRLASYVCSRSVVWPDLSVGDNCFILENQTIQPTVKIGNNVMRSEEHTSELQSLMRISYAVFCLNKKLDKRSKQNKNSI